MVRDGGTEALDLSGAGLCPSGILDFHFFIGELVLMVPGRNRQLKLEKRMSRPIITAT